jgi:hypothetical protein
MADIGLSLAGVRAVRGVVLSSDKLGRDALDGDLSDSIQRAEKRPGRVVSNN